MLKLIKKILKFAVLVATLSVCLSLVSILANKFPSYYIRYKVAPSVVMLVNTPPNPNGYGGGTGFHIKAASGKTVIISNRHVCEGGEKQGFMWGSVRGSDEQYQKLKILEMYDSADLCVLEPIPGVKPLSLSLVQPTQDQSIWAVGHPNLQPKTITHGEVQGFDNMEYPSGVHGRDGYDIKECKYKNERVIQVDLKKKKIITSHTYGSAPLIVPPLNVSDENASLGQTSRARIKACLVSNFSMVTTVHIYKGSSGSPVVDDLGNVVSVIFAMAGDSKWGRAITYIDLKALLSKY